MTLIRNYLVQPVVEFARAGIVAVVFFVGLWLCFAGALSLLAAASRHIGL